MDNWFCDWTDEELRDRWKKLYGDKNEDEPKTN